MSWLGVKPRIFGLHLLISWAYLDDKLADSIYSNNLLEMIFGLFLKHFNRINHRKSASINDGCIITVLYYFYWSFNHNIILLIGKEIARVVIFPTEWQSVCNFFLRMTSFSLIWVCFCLMHCWFRKLNLIKFLY